MSQMQKFWYNTIMIMYSDFMVIFKPWLLLKEWQKIIASFSIIALQSFPLFFRDSKYLH